MENTNQPPAPVPMIPAAVADLQREATERALRWAIGEGSAQARIAGEQIGRARADFDRLRGEWDSHSAALEAKRQQALERVDELTNRNDVLETRIDELQPEIVRLRRIVSELTQSRAQAIELARDAFADVSDFAEGSPRWRRAEVLRGRLSSIVTDPIEGLADELEALEALAPDGWPPGTLEQAEAGEDPADFDDDAR